jgi:hypothetical protein
MVGLFLLGLILFNPPVLNLFGGTINGWPVLYLYLFGAWAVMIGLLALVVERGGPSEMRSGDQGRRAKASSLRLPLVTCSYCSPSPMRWSGDGGGSTV